MSSERTCLRPPTPQAAWVHQIHAAGGASGSITIVMVFVRWFVLFVCFFLLVTRQSDTSYLCFRGVLTKCPTQACTIPPAMYNMEGQKTGIVSFKYLSWMEWQFDSPDANYNAVDRNDRDIEEYSTTIRTNLYYLRIFCWALDRVIHAAYVVVCFLIKSDIGQK